MSGKDPRNKDYRLKIMETQQPGFDQNPVPFTVGEHLPSLLKPFFVAS